MMRNLGGSIGIGTLSTLVRDRYRMHFSRIAESVSVVDPQAQLRIEALTKGFIAKSRSCFG